MSIEERFETVGGLAPRPLFVGARRYDIPATSRAVHPSGARLAYVRDASGRVFILTESGEVEAPAPLAASLAAEYFPEVPPGH